MLTATAVRAARAARVLRAIVIFAALAWPRPATAHPVPFSYLDLRLQGDAIEGSLVVHMFDAAHDLNVEPPERLLNADVALQRAAELTRLFSDRLAVSADGRRLSPQWLAPDVVADRQSLRFPVRFALSSRPGTLTVFRGSFPTTPSTRPF